MKKIISLLFLIFIYTSCLAQKKQDVFQLYNKDWSLARSIESAIYFMEKTVEDDTTYICRFYYKNGPMIIMETYRDTGMEIRHGRFAWYNRKGDMDSAGFYYHGIKDKYWDYGLDDSSHPKITEEYNKGILIRRLDYHAKKIYWANGKEESLEESEIPHSLSENSKDLEVAAQFKNGGLRGWSKYLSANVVVPERFMQLASFLPDKTIRVAFEINKEGDVSDVFVIHSCEWSADTEIMRVIKKSPPWIPALHNGKKTFYRHIQKISLGIDYRR